MALIDPALIDIRIKELHGKKILITMCLSGWRHALRFATDHFHAKFHSDSDGDGFKAQKPIIGLN